MNRTIIININGVIFHIEEEAYEILKSYMTEVKQHFAGTSGNDEIVADIENRIAEMFTELLEREKKQVITIPDVTQTTAQMGRVSEFEIEEEPVTNSNTVYTDHKLFRVPDNRALGGVCAGIGHYFDTEARWIRLIFAISILIGGTGIIVYLILWIIMPPATTRAEKMAMRGEEINLQNLKKRFDEEFDAVKQNLHKVHRDAGPALNKLSGFIEETGTKLLQIAGAGIAKLAGFIIVLLGGVVLFALVIALLLALGLFNDADRTLFPLNVINEEYFTPIAVNAFAILFIPAISLVLFAFRILLNRRIIGRTSSFVLLLIWLTSICSGVFYAARIGSEFKREGSFTKTVSLADKTSFYLSLDDTNFIGEVDSIEINKFRFRETIVFEGDEGLIREPHLIGLKIEKSDIEKPELILTYQSRGPNYKKALKNAGEIKYDIIIRDSLICFPHEIRLPERALWRNQEVKMVLRVPENTVINFGPKMNRILENINLWVCPEGNDPEAASSQWEMSKEGLRCKLQVNEKPFSEKSPD